MSGKAYWKQRIPLLGLHGFCMAALSVFLLVNGNSADSIIFILVVWFLILAAYFLLTCYGRKIQMEKLLKLTEQLEERYLISEVMEKPDRADDQVYYQILKLAGKSMLEQIGAVRRERRKYREYIEQWVHEVKTLITAMKLLCENNRSPLTKSLLVELEKKTALRNRRSTTPEANIPKRITRCGKSGCLMLSIRR